MGFLQRLDAFRRGHQHDGADMGAAIALEHVDGGNQRPAGRQHRVDDQRQAFVKLADEAFKVGFGHQCFMVACNAHDADLGAGDQIQHAIQHAQTGPQDRHHGNLLALDLLDIHRPGPALDGAGFQLEIPTGFISQQTGQFGRQFAEFLGTDTFFTQQTDFVFDEWVTNFNDRHGNLQRMRKWGMSRNLCGFGAFRLRHLPGGADLIAPPVFGFVECAIRLPEKVVQGCFFIRIRHGDTHRNCDA